MSKNTNPYEYNEQCAIFRWAKTMEHIHPELKWLCGNLEGLRLPPGLSMKAKRAGMKAGRPDIHLPIRRNGFTGLYIELKRVGGQKPKPHQVDYMEMLVEQGNAVYVCYGAENAIKVIKDYLTRKDKSCKHL